MSLRSCFEFLLKFTQVELLDHNPIFSVLSNLVLFSPVVSQVYISSNSVQGLHFLCILTSILLFSVLFIIAILMAVLLFS